MNEPAGDQEKSDDIVIVDSEAKTTWEFDRRFLSSNWECQFGRGCKGILDHPSPELEQGCCSLGAELDDDEARMLAAMTSFVDPTRFQNHDHTIDGIFAPDSSDENGWRTRVVDGACIFLNRPGFEGGGGCALHLEASARGESPTQWKPGVCWQLPLHVDYADNGDGSETATVRPWSRADWGDRGTTMAWCCTEEPDAFTGDSRVIDSLSGELETMLGTAVFVELTRRVGDD